MEGRRKGLQNFCRRGLLQLYFLFFLPVLCYCVNVQLEAVSLQTEGKNMKGSFTLAKVMSVRVLLPLLAGFVRM